MSAYKRLPQSDDVSLKRDHDDSKLSRLFQDERNNLPFRGYLRSKVITTALVSAAVLVCGYAFISLFPSSNVQSELADFEPSAAKPISSILDALAPAPTGWRPTPTLDPTIDDVPGVYIANIHDPEALDAQNECPGYIASDVRHNDFGFTARLRLAGKHCNVYGTDVEELDLEVQFQSAERLSISIVPTYLDASNASQYLVPTQYLNRPLLDSDAASTVPKSDLELVWSNDPTFNFAVHRKSNKDVLFSTAGSKLIFEDQFIEFVTAMPENYNIAGLGEHLHNIRLGNNITLTLYNADTPDPVDENLYGSHPFYLDTRYYEVDSVTGHMSLVTNDSSSHDADYKVFNHGVYLRNTHGQEVLLSPSSVTWRTLGGSIDLFFFSGPTQTDVTKQYQEGAVGFPAMQQYWTLGYHQCRWGYANWSQLQEVVDNFRKFEIPLETIWLDIDYMNQYRNFENDQNTFGYHDGAKFLDRLHAGHQHFIPIVDSAIYIPNPENASDAYPTYTRGNDSSVFLMNPDGSQYIGAVWPGYTVFPDWRSAATQAWWTYELKNWFSKISFDGIWVDMSEVSSFCVGSCGTGHVTENPVNPPFLLGGVSYDYPESFEVTNATEAAEARSAAAQIAREQTRVADLTRVVDVATATTTLRTKVTPGVRNLNAPPYAINNVRGSLLRHAVAPNATHHDGVSEYEIHNLFGYEIINATYNALLSVLPEKRPFIIGRSTFAGSGALAGHWGGDNFSKWAYMYFSIPQALSMSLFGISMFGVDTCGFAGNTDEELCNRWMQLSAFFPFYRNHAAIDANPQEPYLWSSVAEATRTAMRIRYTLLPYFYTLTHLASTRGTTIMRALAWEFPLDGPSLLSADRQFLLGSSILVTPVLTPQATSVDGVFPGWSNKTRWYDWYSGTLANEIGSSKNVTIEAPLGHIPVFVRGGSVVVGQEPGYTIRESRQGGWNIIVALDGSSAAKGELYLDDGESLDVGEEFRSVSLEVSEDAATGAVSLQAKGNGRWVDSNSLRNVTVMGVNENVCSLSWNGKDVGKDVKLNWDAKRSVLSVVGLQAVTEKGAWTENWTLSWRSLGCGTLRA